MARTQTVLLIQLFLISCYNAVPIENDLEVLDNNSIDMAENSIDGADNSINLSHLGSEAFGSPKNESGDALTEWNESSLMNPEEMGSYAEGDILIPHPLGRNGVREQSSWWPNGIIPYVIEGYYNQEQRDLIRKAIADYHRLTCLRFVPYNGQKDYITIQSGNTGCWSSVGRIGGRQEVNLQAPGCVSKKGTVLHELLHAVGFMHEQSRPERDDFVTVVYNNIKPGAENNFRKADKEHTNDFGVTYDYNSVMHYSEYAFSRNSKKTIEPKVSGVTLGQREGLSRGDVKKVNNMYKCKKEAYPTSLPYGWNRIRRMGHGSPRGPGFAGSEPQSGWVGNIFQSLFGHKMANPLCRACMETEETSTHVILECRSLSRQRTTYLGSPRTLVEACGRVRKLTGFLEELGWQD
ncbi:unnamed protein product [Diatraea saccharalis]|uniref:Metalloendopeptidase n=1 Tax=Diatraea saccharalis TaxID=40085 RepID=A0A9N9R8F4_9NEOP|nr:unnamed protein product [Diatraea saccharalis]